jgi:hypothetical protein
MGINPYEPGKSENMEYAKGGPAKKGMGIMIGIKFGKPKAHAKGGKVKGDKKKVMGTVGEAKALMNAMKKVRRPATPMPGARMAGLGMAPPMAPPMAFPMAPPMKRGGKVMMRGANGAAKPRKKSPMPNKIKMMFYKKGV